MSKSKHLTNLDNIPEKLGRIDQWVLFHLVPQPDGKLKKLPSSYKTPGLVANPLDPINWGSFDDVSKVAASAPTLYGMGFVLTRDAGIVCFDIDHKGDPDAFAKSLEEAKDKEVWSEISVSGKGLHSFVLGVLPDDRASMNDAYAGVEIYGDKRFIAVTGRKVKEEPADLTDGTAFIRKAHERYKTQLAEKMGQARSPSAATPEHDAWRGRLSNDRVLSVLARARPETRATLDAPAPDGKGSELLRNAVGDLMKITTDHAQIIAILDRTPLAQSRPDKWPRLIDHWLEEGREQFRSGQARPVLNITQADIDGGCVLDAEWRRARDAEKKNLPATLGARIASLATGTDGETPIENDARKAALISAMDELKRCGSAEDVDDAQEEAEEAAREEAEKKLSSTAITARLLETLSGYKAWPSEWMLSAIDASERAMRSPHRGFAEFAAITFAGPIVALNYRTTDSLTTAQPATLVAPSGGGKGEASRLMLKAYADACISQWVKKGLPASTEKAHGIIQNFRICVNYTPDAGADVESITKPANTQQKAQRDWISIAFDNCEFGQTTIDPKGSLNGDGRGERPVSGARYVPIWVLTPSAMSDAYSTAMSETGLGSRMSFDVQEEEGGDVIPGRDVVPVVPEWLSNWVDREAAKAIAVNALYSELDNTSIDLSKADRTILKIYKANRAQVWQKIELATVMVPYSTEAEMLLERIEAEQNKIMRHVRKRDIGGDFTVYARTSVQIKKLALLDAVIGRDAGKDVLQITAQNVAWAATIIFGRMDRLMKFIEGGAGGGNDGKREKWVMGWFKLRGTAVSLSELKAKARNNSMFNQHVKGSTEVLEKALNALVREGKLSVMTIKGGLRYTRLR